MSELPPTFAPPRTPVAVKSWRAGLGLIAIGASFGLAGCRHGSSPDAQVRPEPVAVAALSVGLDASIWGTDRRVLPATAGFDGEQQFDVAGARVVVNLADADAIKAALLARLRGQPSYIEDRGYLLERTQRGSLYMGEGLVRVAGWTLYVLDDELTLMYRMPPGPAATQQYTATVERSGTAWVVSAIVQGQIRRR